MFDDGEEWFDWVTLAYAVAGAALLFWLVVRFADWQTRDVRKML